MNPDENSASPDSNDPNVTSSPNPQPPAQPTTGTVPNPNASPNQPPQAPVQQKGPIQNIDNRPLVPQTAQKYPAFQKFDSTREARQSQQASTPQVNNQAHYNAHLDTHVIQPTVTTQETDSSRPKKSKKKFLAVLGILLFLIAVGGSATLAWGVAYNKVELKNYPKAELAIKQVVFSLPFTQKPPEYLLAKTIEAHQGVTRESFDVSVAIGSDELNDPLGISQLDFQVKGNVDYTNPKNVFFNTEIFLTKGLNIELKKKEKNVYFNIKDIPSFFLAFAGMNKSQFEPVLNKWVSWDISPLDTEARRTITDQETNYLSSEFSDELFADYADDYILENLTVEDGEVDGHRAYKIKLDADKEMIDYIQRKLENSSNQDGKFSVLGYTADSPKLSDVVKTLTGEIYIDKNSYYTRKAILSMTFEYDSSELSGLGLGIVGSSGNSSGTFAFAAKFDNFGEEVVVNEPAADMTSDEFMEKISTIVTEIYSGIFSGATGSTGGILSPDKDSERASALSQLKFALKAYNLDCGVYPKTLDRLLESACGGSPSGYVTVLPKDPSGSDYYYQSDGATFSLCANLDSPEIYGNLSSETTCPDPSYNFHISSADL